jgi:rfaE bifunctional protein kinase chain/domain
MHLKERLASKTILVVGDIILDHYIYGKVYRVSPEAPVPVVLKDKSTYCLGGSANVAQNITSFGAKCYLLGVVGEDSTAIKIHNLLSEKEVLPMLVKDPSRPSTEKTRIIGNGHQIVRIDSEVDVNVSEEISDKVFEMFMSIVEDLDGVIIQDYGKGLLSRSLVKRILQETKERNIPTLTDPKDKDFSKYTGSDWIKPNFLEFKDSLGIPSNRSLDSLDVIKLIDELKQKFNLSSVLLTLSENGMIARSKFDFESIDGIQIEVTDVSGAGDTVSAVFMLLLSSNISLKDCLRISNLSGSIVCQTSGAIPIDINTLFSTLHKYSWIVSDKTGEPVLL